MKKFIIIFIFFYLQPGFGQGSAGIQAILDSLNADSLIYFTKELSGNVPAIIDGTSYTILSRHKDQPGNDMATLYIKEKLDSYGLTTTIQEYSTTGKNIFGEQTGYLYPNKKYIICAHMDALPDGIISPGADDNASGTAAVLEIARLLKDYLPAYTLVYALWDEEEAGFLGSTYYADQASAAGDSIMGVINLDMLGYDSNNDSICEIHTRSVGSSLSLSAAMVQCNIDYNLGLEIAVINPGVYNSDQGPFWGRGYGAILLIEDYTNELNPSLHRLSDTIGNFNIPYFIKMARLATATFCTLIELQELPAEAVEDTNIPVMSALVQNYPNPFNPSTTIKYYLPFSSNTKLEVYDIYGSKVAVLVDEFQNGGEYSISFDGNNLASGIYIYKLQAGNFISTKKMTLIR
jgi:hypothetical protein